MDRENSPKGLQHRLTDPLKTVGQHWTAIAPIKVLFNPPVLIFLLILATRLLFQSRLVRAGDTGNFVLAVTHFAPQLEQPQMPGMFIVFVFLGRFFNVFLHDPLASLVMVNTVASGVAAVMVYWIGSRWFRPKVGWTAALLLLSSPMLWFQGETALSHMLEFCWVLLIDYAAYYTGLGDRRALFSLAVLMGLAGGVRPSTPFFLLPLALVACWLGLRTRKFNPMHLGAAVGVGIGAIALWLVPLLVLSGGWQAYWQLVQGWLPVHTQRQDADTLFKVFSNLTLLLETSLPVVGLAVIPLVWWLSRAPKAEWWRHLRWDWRIQTLAWSALPGALYFIFVHLRRKEQALTIMPTVLVLAAYALVWVSDRLQNRYRQAWAILIAAIVSVNSLFFLFGPVGAPTLSDIRNFEHEFTERIETIQRTFPPETTAVLAYIRYSRLVDIYLPAYQEANLSRRAKLSPVVLSPAVQTLVLLDSKVLRKPGQTEGFQTLALPSGNTLRYRKVGLGERLKVTDVSIQVVPNNVEKSE